MQNQDHIDKLIEGAIGWNSWREKDETIIPNLTSANLNGAEIDQANLSYANLNDARLIGASLIEANLVKANLIGANLNDAYLDGADLGRANLGDANLNGADLSSVNLAGSDLNGADLRNANLAYADLAFADFRNANIANANLCGAYLHFTNFSNSTLVKADFTKANVYESIFANADLRKAKSLETCRHSGPSTVDHRTLEKSGILPPAFLRGCGLPDSLIDYLPALLNEPISYYSCFISYSHSNKAFARRLHDQLQGRGIRCWLDEHQVLPGDKVHDLIDRGIRYWDKVLLCASKDSLSSWWVGSEINKAFKKEQVLGKQKGKKVLSLIPLDLDGYLFDWEDGLADEVRSRYAPSFIGWEASNNIFEKSLESVVKAMQTGKAGREAVPIQKL